MWQYMLYNSGIYVQINSIFYYLHVSWRPFAWLIIWSNHRSTSSSTVVSYSDLFCPVIFDQIICLACCCLLSNVFGFCSLGKVFNKFSFSLSFICKRGRHRLNITCNFVLFEPPVLPRPYHNYHHKKKRCEQINYKERQHIINYWIAFQLL